MKKRNSSSSKAMTRRDLLRGAGKASLTLAAAQALSPFWLAGCSDSTSTGGKTGISGKVGGSAIKVGILHSLTEFMAISEKSLHDVELMAIEEINAAGGVLGRMIDPKIEDPASDFDRGFPEKARKLLQDDKVTAVFGCWTSASRKSVLPIFEKSNGLLFYPVQYEGNECSKNVIYTGAAPNQQILPAVDYLWKEMGKRKFYLLGSDYIFPRTANQIVRAQLKNIYKAEPAAEKYADLKQRDFKDIVDDIKKVNPDVIFSTINGDSNIPFYNELAANGITADKAPVCAMSVAEDELRGLIGKAKIEGHLAAWNYFQSVETPDNKKFVDKFKAKYGKDRVTDDPIEAAYFQVYFWKLAVEKAKSTEVDDVRKAFMDADHPIEFNAPGGMVRVDPRNFHTWKPFRMGKIKPDGQFEIIYEKKDGSGKVELVRPEPYPRVAYKKDCDWIKSPEKGEIDLTDVKS